MKKALFGSILLILLMVACTGRRGVHNAGGGETVFDISEEILANRPDTLVTLGKIYSGEIIQYDAWLRNASSSPLVIIGVETSCGCTSIEYERSPILPGKKGRFSFRFDSRGMWGMQQKLIEIHTSASPQRYRLFVRAEVMESSS